ncbi:MAG: 3-oxoacyl-ACP reductase [Myxococcales bacterium]|nr:3-oxoacyl-ACP reductase [Myxococcales bacterium]
MNDLLLELGKNKNARRLLGSLGLPLPLPESLRRERGPLVARPLADRAVAVAAPRGGTLLATIAETLTAAGADAWLLDAADDAVFQGPGETFGRPARLLAASPERLRLDAVVIDASALADAASLRALFDALSPLMPRLARSARVVVLGREGLTERRAAAAQAALEGFVRSVAKEIGRVGATANLVRVVAGAELRLPAVLRFVLSARSAFVTGQPIVVDAIARPLPEPPWVRSLEGRVALVTGAARGIGEATARRLAEEGAHVVCLDRPADDGPLSQLARSLGGSALAVDLQDADAPARVAAHLGARGVDVVVHNAGITRDKTLARMKPELWDAVLDVNLGAVERLHEALLPHLRDQGRVVCLSSIAGLAGNMGQTAYAASKSGVVGWVRAEAQALASRGVTVNAIAPGFIETRLTAAIPLAIREVARRLSALGQGGLPGDVAEAITFLATPGAQGLTGRTLRVCGGAFVGA